MQFNPVVLAVEASASRLAWALGLGLGCTRSFWEPHGDGWTRGLLVHVVAGRWFLACTPLIPHHPIFYWFPVSKLPLSFPTHSTVIVFSLLS